MTRQPLNMPQQSRRSLRYQGMNCRGRLECHRVGFQQEFNDSISNRQKAERDRRKRHTVGDTDQVQGEHINPCGQGGQTTTSYLNDPVWARGLTTLAKAEKGPARNRVLEVVG